VGSPFHLVNFPLLVKLEQQHLIFMATSSCVVVARPFIVLTTSSCVEPIRNFIILTTGSCVVATNSFTIENFEPFSCMNIGVEIDKNGEGML